MTLMERKLMPEKCCGKSKRIVTPSPNALPASNRFEARWLSESEFASLCLSNLQLICFQFVLSLEIM